MDGDLAPLSSIISLAHNYNALVLVDECHATGFIGSTGRGTEEAYDVAGGVDIINSTLGKAMSGAMGGYTTGPKPLIQMLHQRSRPSLFSNSLAPSVVGSALKAFELLNSNLHLTARLQVNVELFRKSMSEAGFQLMGSPLNPICPVFLGDAKLASEFADAMLKQNIYVIGFSYPVVPKGKARIRVQISAAHSTDQINQCIEAFKTTGKKLGTLDSILVVTAKSNEFHLDVLAFNSAGDVQTRVSGPLTEKCVRKVGVLGCVHSSGVQDSKIIQWQPGKPGLKSFNVSCRAERITDLTFFGGTRNISIGFAEEGDHQLNIESIDLRNKQLFELGIQRELADSETIILIPDPSPGGVVAIDLESAFHVNVSLIFNMCLCLVMSF
uniref:Aminotransferase class I/classII domain-containing protein n=1 Tax=Ditylenchus dipsaci TaxID=166011 RepID=A0A915EA61_9BILA